jgi:hypothetical protein
LAGCLGIAGHADRFHFRAACLVFCVKAVALGAALGALTATSTTATPRFGAGLTARFSATIHTRLAAAAIGTDFGAWASALAATSTSTTTAAIAPSFTPTLTSTFP